MVLLKKLALIFKCTLLCYFEHVIIMLDLTKETICILVKLPIKSIKNMIFIKVLNRNKGQKILKIIFICIFNA